MQLADESGDGGREGGEVGFAVAAAVAGAAAASYCIISIAIDSCCGRWEADAVYIYARGREQSEADRIRIRAQFITIRIGVVCGGLDLI